MNPDETLLSEVCRLCIRAMDNALTTDEFDRFEMLLQSDKRARAYYFDIISTYVGLDTCQRAADTFSESERLNLLLEIAAEEEEAAPALDILKPDDAAPRELIQNVQRESVFQKPSKSSLIVLMTSAAAILFLIVFARFTPDRSSYEVATLTDSIQAQWSRQHGAVSRGGRLFARYGDYVLESGIVMIDLDNQTRITIEGPAQFRFLAQDQVALDYGKVYATVPPGAYGFQVSTPTAKIIDLGTEFGVYQAAKGNTEVHVIKGKVQFFSGQKGRFITGQMVNENQAFRFDFNRGQVHPIAVEQNAFIRQINSEGGIVRRGEDLSLADVVGGGDGFGTGQINKGINHAGRQAVLKQIAHQRVDRSQFVPVPSNPFVEGIFVPDGTTSIVASGEFVHDFESTNRAFYLGVLNGAWHENIRGTVPRHALRLRGTVYGTSERPGLYMHANQGITFDLEAIRRYTKMDIRRFTSICGVSESYGDHDHNTVGAKNQAGEPKASFYVLVDGRKKFAQRDMTYLDKAVEISIEIGPQDRFLTLVTTEGSDKSNDGDWTLFGEPVLMLEKN